MAKAFTSNTKDSWHAEDTPQECHLNAPQSPTSDSFAKPIQEAAKEKTAHKTLPFIKYYETIVDNYTIVQNTVSSRQEYKHGNDNTIQEKKRILQTLG